MWIWCSEATARHAGGEAEARDKRYRRHESCSVVNTGYLFMIYVYIYRRYGLFIMDYLFVNMDYLLYIIYIGRERESIRVL